MKHRGRRIGSFLGLILLILADCSCQSGLLAPKEGSQASLPFETSPYDDGISPTQSLDSTSIPSGTAVVIRLDTSLSSAECHAGDRFEAVLDGPVVVHGQTLAPRGTVIRGTVLAAKPSERRMPGYLRLTLSVLILDGKTFDLHTSSLFSKGSPPKHFWPRSGKPDVQFSTDRRLTFRLTQPLPLRG